MSISNVEQAESGPVVHTEIAECGVAGGRFRTGDRSREGGGQGSAYQGAVSVSPGVWLYQLIDKGLALELTAKGTKYYKDGDLN